MSGASADEELLAAHVQEARQAQRDWSERPLAARLQVLRAFRRYLAVHARDAVSAVAAENRSPAEVLATEVLPLADACRFTETEAPRVLRTRRHGWWSAPLWLTAHASEVRRVPHGLVLILAPFNYPLFLPGSQALQALAAGNAVLWKPGRRGRDVALWMHQALRQVGLPAGLLQVLDESSETGAAALEAGPDFVILTGGVETGRAVAAKLAQRPAPAALELSGVDAVLVLRGADVRLAARAVAWGVTLNGGATCLAPRRVIVEEFVREAFVKELKAVWPATPVRITARQANVALRLILDALKDGARLDVGILPKPTEMQDGLSMCDWRPILMEGIRPEQRLVREDIFLPVVSVLEADDSEAAVRMHNACPFGLGAAVFGPERVARALAERLETGSVTVNDLIAPTADPRLPFSGLKQSGYGVTRGAEGLLALTRPQALAVRGGSWRPHYDAPQPGDEALFEEYLRTVHGGWGGWFGSARRLLAALWKRWRAAPPRETDAQDQAHGRRVSLPTPAPTDDTTAVQATTRIQATKGT